LQVSKSKINQGFLFLRQLRVFVHIVLVVHACNPSYLRDRDQKGCGSKPAQAKMCAKPYPQNTQQKASVVEWLKW
jgi:hypothetical protein